MSQYWARIENVVFPKIHQWRYGYQRKGWVNPLHKNKPIPDNVIYLDQYREEKGDSHNYGVILVGVQFNC
jgi:hypothetical protein